MERRRFIEGLVGLSAVVSAKAFASKTQAPGNAASSGKSGVSSSNLISSIRDGAEAAVLMRHPELHAGSFGPQRIPLLVLVVTHGSIAQMSGLIDLRVDVNGASTEGHTALKAALMRGASERAQKLLQAGARVGVAGKRSEIQAAVVGGDEDCIDLIIAEGQLPDAAAIEASLRLRRYRVAESLWRTAGESADMLADVKLRVIDRSDLVVTAEGWH